MPARFGPATLGQIIAQPAMQPAPNAGSVGSGPAFAQPFPVPTQAQPFPTPTATQGFPWAGLQGDPWTDPPTGLRGDPWTDPPTGLQATPSTALSAPSPWLDGDYF